MCRDGLLALRVIDGEEPFIRQDGCTARLHPRPDRRGARHGPDVTERGPRPPPPPPRARQAQTQGHPPAPARAAATSSYLRDWLTRRVPPRRRVPRRRVRARRPPARRPVLAHLPHPAATPSPTVGARNRQLIGVQLRANVLAITDGWCDMPHLTGSEQDDVWAALVQAREGRLTRSTIATRHASGSSRCSTPPPPLRGYTLVPDGRHDALMALRNHGEFTRPDAELFVRPERGNCDPPARSGSSTSKTGEQFIRAGETTRSCADVCRRASLQWSDAPGSAERDRRRGGPVRAPPQPAPEGGPLPAADDLVEYVEAASPSPAPARKQQSLIDNERASRWPA